MAIFGNLILEKIIQVNDKTRLNATSSFVSKGEAAITAIEIEPEAAAGFVDVFDADADNWFLDWEYAGATRTVIVSVRITTDGGPVVSTETIEVIVAADDKLFSSDKDLTKHEPDLMRWVVEGRNSFLDVHRRSQERILAYLDEKGWSDDKGNRITIAAFIDLQEGKEWSIFLTLRLIFESMSNSIDDVFIQKSLRYKSQEVKARNRAQLRLDTDGDSVLEDGEGHTITSIRVFRR